jgi:ATP-dependent DNA helicase RecG
VRSFAGSRELSRAELLGAPVHWPRPAVLEVSIGALEGVGPKLSAAAAEAGIHTVGDVLYRFPHSHRDRTIQPLSDLEEGQTGTVLVEVLGSKPRPFRRPGLTITSVKVGDDSAHTKATWFNQPWVAEKLNPGARLLITGKLSKRGLGVNEYEVLPAGGGEGEGPRTDALARPQDPPPRQDPRPGAFVPVHPATEALKAQRIRDWAEQACRWAPNVIEGLPAELRARRALPAVADAIRTAHFPESPEEAEQALERVAFEELFLYQAILATRKRSHRAARPAPRLGKPGEPVGRWVDSLPFEPTGGQLAAFDEIDADIDSGEPMQRLLMGEVGSGKAQPLDSLILTPQGFRLMGEIKAGDKVVNPAGGSTTVVGVFPQGRREVWRVSFSDGTSAECDAEHLWQVQTSAARSRGDTPKVKPLHEIASDLLAANGSAKWHIELSEATDLDADGERPVDPYLLGLLLGDGGLSRTDRVTFTSADSELVEAVRCALPPGCKMRREHHRPYDWKIIGVLADHGAALARAQPDDPPSIAEAYVAGASQETIATRVGLTSGIVRRRLLSLGIQMRPSHRSPSPLATALASLDLMGKGAYEKAVPGAYLAAPISERHAVLQGLMDTDGTVARNGMNVTFASASRQLAEDVAWIVRSLGGRARCRPRRINAGVYWRTSVILPAKYPPFRLKRKSKRMLPRTKYAHPAKAIIGVERVGRKEVQCIAVAHPNQLYITDGFTVTHNTVVAVYAMLRAIEAGFQAALMAPTETLAEQHAITLGRLLAEEAIPFALITGSTSAASRRRALDQLASGELGLILGTHALIEPTVQFARLGLCVVDEQHRFGVEQRRALDRKGVEGMAPHILHMTATPIPRTLSLTAYGDLDTTALHELPAGRQPVETWLVGEDRRAGAYDFLRQRLREGRQAFVVCPLVEVSEKIAGKAAESEAERLRAGELRDFAVGLLHGQMSSAEKGEAMRAFAAGETDVLVATTVIEVGIDVPNATVMMIEGAERFGVSQLHQLRGRVGRGEHSSQCMLFAAEPGGLGRQRLKAVAKERDGFKLAEIDLSLRGEGEILGTRQSGLPRFAVASLPEDAEALIAARDEVLALLARHGSLADPALGPLLDAARRRFGAGAADPIPL